jgi:hypothetical protein
MAEVSSLSGLPFLLPFSLDPAVDKAFYPGQLFPWLGGRLCHLVREPIVRRGIPRAFSSLADCRIAWMIIRCPDLFHAFTITCSADMLSLRIVVGF